MPEEIYIPPPGIYFRLLGTVSQNVLYSRPKNDPEVGHYPRSLEFPDQYFSLLYGTGAHQGKYAIKGRESGKVLFSRSSAEPHIGHIAGDGHYYDNWFTFEQGKGQHAKEFRLLTPSTGQVIYSRNTAEPKCWNHPAGGVYSDQYFTFLFEDMQVDKVEWDLKFGVIISSEPCVLATMTLSNGSSQVQEMSFSLNESVGHDGAFEGLAGFPVAAGTTFQAGVPRVEGDGFGVDYSVGKELEWSKTISFTKHYMATVPVKAGPGKTVKVTSTVTKGKLTMPFTVYLSSKSKGMKVESQGVWTGMSSWNLRNTTTET